MPGLLTQSLFCNADVLLLIAGCSTAERADAARFAGTTSGPCSYCLIAYIEVQVPSPTPLPPQLANPLEQPQAPPRWAPLEGLSTRPRRSVGAAIPQASDHTSNQAETVAPASPETALEAVASPPFRVDAVLNVDESGRTEPSA
eukprot:SM000168S02629  [mRNA]  locus=s168:222539:223379:+ [translate_table: standard]